MTNGLNGKKLADVTHVSSLSFPVSGHHREQDSTTHHWIPLCTSCPWLKKHKPHIDRVNKILGWSLSYSSPCLCKAKVPLLLTEDHLGLSWPHWWPPGVHGLQQSWASLTQPPHHPYDCDIDFLPGRTAPWGPLCPFSSSETDVTEYIQDSLAAGITHLFSSPAGTGFFFMANKDGSQCPCEWPQWHHTSPCVFCVWASPWFHPPS